MPEKKLIIFDFDGVLIDTLIPCYEISREVNESMTLEDYQSYFDGNIFSSLGVGKNLRKKHPNFENRYEERTREVVIPSEIKNFLTNLSKTHNFVIVSSTPTRLIEQIFDREGIRNLFSDILGCDVHVNKAIKLDMVLQKYSTIPKDTVFITDTLGDIREGNEVAIPSIAVTWGYQDRNTLRKGEPFAIVDTVQELEQTLEKYFLEPRN